MSSQSGITASSELLQAFKNLKNAVLAITLSADSTHLEEDTSIAQPSGSDLGSIFKSLHSHFSKQYPEPGYAVFPRPGSEDYVFISFIPDLAPIRKKMLFASTKNTLVQQLGSGSFGKNYILAFSELDELSESHYKHATLSEQDPSLLTEAEKSLKELNSLQSLTLSQTSGSAYKKELPSMHGLGNGSLFFKIDTKLDLVLRQSIDKTVVVMNISSSEELVLTAQESGVQSASLISTILKLVESASSVPLYILFGYAPGKVAFVYLCPSGSKVRDRMVYAANKQGLLVHLKADYFSNGQIDQVLEVGDLDEIEISRLSDTPATTLDKDQSGLKFSKPKGPRRR